MDDTTTPQNTEPSNDQHEFWHTGYQPRDPKHRELLKEHSSWLVPLIAATPAPDTKTRRAIAVFVLGYLEWALPLGADPDSPLDEYMVGRYLDAKPRNWLEKSKNPIRGRFAAVLATLNETQPTEATPSPAPKSAPYPNSAMDALRACAADSPVLAEAMTLPWRPYTQTQWSRVQRPAAIAIPDLSRHRLRLTLHVEALAGAPSPWHAHLNGISGAQLVAASRHLPKVPPARTGALLRGDDGQCTTTPSEHSAAATHEVTLQVPAHTGGTMPRTTKAPRKKTARHHSSAAAVRRKAAQLRARAAATPERFSEEFRIWLNDRYTPTEPTKSHWPTIKDTVALTLARTSITGEESLRKHVTHLGHFFTWAHLQGLALTPEALNRENVARYVSDPSAGLTKTVEQKRRSLLSQLADDIHPHKAPYKGREISKSIVAPPYTAEELADICRAAELQPTALRKRQLCLLVGLGAGAVLDSSEVKRARRHHIIDHGPEIGIEVRATRIRTFKDGSRQEVCRTTWVLRKFEHLVRLGLDGLGADDLVLGQNPERSNVANAIFAHGSFGESVPAITQGRLRSTWLAHQLCRPVPLNVLMEAAGLTSARTITDLLRYLPKETDTARILR